METINEVSLRRLNPAGYLRSFLANGVRPDGRKPESRRLLGKDDLSVQIADIHINSCVYFRH
jgi:hypothetical protein